MKKIIILAFMLAFAGIVTLAINAQTVTDTLPASMEDTTIVFPLPQEDNATTLQDKLSKAVDITMKVTVVIQIFLAFYMISFTLLVSSTTAKRNIRKQNGIRSKPKTPHTSNTSAYLTQRSYF